MVWTASKVIEEKLIKADKNLNSKTISLLWFNFLPNMKMEKYFSMMVVLAKHHM